MPDDNGAINKGTLDDCGADCVSTDPTQCGVEESSNACSTPYCDDALATLPRTLAGRLLLRIKKCLYNNPTLPDKTPKVWVRDTDGLDKLTDLTQAMIPASGDRPCYADLDSSDEDTYGKQLIAQVDDDTGKTCIKEVPLEDTDDAFLAGIAAEPLCSGTPDIRPKRIIPEDMDGCSDSVKLLGAVEEEVEVQPGLKRTKTLWRWLKSIVLPTDNIDDRDGTETDGACVLPAAWVVNGSCATLAKLKLENGVVGAWAYCGNCLKFYELPKDGTGAYKKNTSLKYVGGSDCWEWKSGDDECYEIITPVTLTSATTNTTHTFDLSAYNPPECATKALVEIKMGMYGNSGSASVILKPYYNATVQAEAGQSYAWNNARSAYSGVLEIPFIGSGQEIKFEVTFSSYASSKSFSAKLIGFK